MGISFLKKSKIIIISAFLLLLVGFLQPVLAADDNSIIGQLKVRNSKCVSDGDCSIGDLVYLFVIFSNWILGIIGSIMLLMFVYGGFVFILSSGNAAEVKKGKDIIVGAVIGFVIVMSSYVIVEFTLQALGVRCATWSSAGWFGTSCTTPGT